MLFAVTALVGAVKFGAGEGEGFSGKTAALIPHADVESFFGSICGQKDGAIFGRVLYGVVDQIGKDSLQFILLSPDEPVLCADIGIEIIHLRSIRKWAHHRKF